MKAKSTARRAKCSRAKQANIGLLPSQLLVYCPTCGAMDVAHLDGPVLVPKRGFSARGDGIYHACGPNSRSRFHNLGAFECPEGRG